RQGAQEVRSQEGAQSTSVLQEIISKRSQTDGFQRPSVFVCKKPCGEPAGSKETLPINANEWGTQDNALPCTGRQGRAKALSDSAATSFLPGGRGRRAALKSSRALRARGGLPRRERTERRRPGRPAGLDRAPLPGRSGRS